MTAISWRQVFKSPQALVSFAAAAVAILGTAGIINSNLSNAIQTILTAALGIFIGATHTTVTTKLAVKRPVPVKSKPSVSPSTPVVPSPREPTVGS